MIMERAVEDKKTLVLRNMLSCSPAPCSCCGELLVRERRFIAWADSKKGFAVFCKGCLGEIAFDILPKVTGSPSGLSAPYDRLGDGGPWGENAVRALEGD
jgi:hypothetical protein